MNAYLIIPTKDDSADIFQQAIALELAMGVSLSNDPQTWPTGLIAEWNAAAETGAFDATKTLGDLARAFLHHRLTMLDNDKRGKKSTGKQDTGPKQAEIVGWQIFDSFDRPASNMKPHNRDLFETLHELTSEAAAEDNSISFAIGAVFSDGSITFDAG